jgi:hypothetical protein
MLESLLVEFGIPVQKRQSASQSYASEEGPVEVAAWDVSIDVPEGLGFPGFVASFYFDAEESFLAHRVWKKG